MIEDFYCTKCGAVVSAGNDGKYVACSECSTIMSVEYNIEINKNKRKKVLDVNKMN